MVLSNAYLQDICLQAVEMSVPNSLLGRASSDHDLPVKVSLIPIVFVVRYPRFQESARLTWRFSRAADLQRDLLW